MRKSGKQWRTLAIIGLAVWCALPAESNLASADDSSRVKRIVVLGDSLSQGYLLRSSEAWPMLIVDKLRSAGVDFEVGRARHENNARGQITGERDGLLKLLFAVPSKKLLGVHIIGDGATELIHIGQMVMAAGGSIDVFIDGVFNFPTLSELYKYAAYDGLGRLGRRAS